MRIRSFAFDGTPCSSSQEGVGYVRHIGRQENVREIALFCAYNPSMLLLLPLALTLGSLQDRRDPAQALMELERILERSPKTIVPYERHAALLRQIGREREIAPRLDALAAAHPENAAIQWVRLAELARRDFHSAHIRFLNALTTASDPEFFDLLVRTYAAQDRPAELLALAAELFPIPHERGPGTVSSEQSARQQAFADALGRQPGLVPGLLQLAPRSRHSPQLWDLLIWLAERNDRSDELERSLREAYRRMAHDPTADAFERLATHLIRHRQWQSLLDLCETLQGFEAYTTILQSEALAELNRGEEALQRLRQSRLAQFATLRQTAHVLGILGRYQEMLDLLNSMLMDYKDPGDIKRIRYLRAEAFLGLDRFADMEIELREILHDDPDDILALNNLGYNLADRGRKFPEAEQFIRRAIELDRQNRAKAGDARLDHAAYLDSLGWVLFRRGKYTSSRITLEKALDLPDGRNDAIVWDHLGDVCYRQDDKPAAKRAWQMAKLKYLGDHRAQQGGRADELARKLKLFE